MKIEVIPAEMLLDGPGWRVRVDGELQADRWLTRTGAIEWVHANFPKRTLPVMLGDKVTAALARLL